MHFARTCGQIYIKIQVEDVNYQKPLLQLQPEIRPKVAGKVVRKEDSSLIQARDGTEYPKSIVRVQQKYVVCMLKADKVYYKCEDSKRLGCKGVWALDVDFAKKQDEGFLYKQHTAANEEHLFAQEQKRQVQSEEQARNNLFAKTLDGILKKAEGKISVEEIVEKIELQEASLAEMARDNVELVQKYLEKFNETPFLRSTNCDEAQAIKTRKGGQFGREVRKV